MQPCWHCHRFDDLDSSRMHALCALPSGPRVRAEPAHGCVFSERAPGLDDEPGPPAGYRGSAGGWRDLAPVDR